MSNGNADQIVTQSGPGLFVGYLAVSVNFVAQNRLEGKIPRTIVRRT